MRGNCGVNGGEREGGRTKKVGDGRDGNGAVMDARELGGQWWREGERKDKKGVW